MRRPDARMQGLGKPETFTFLGFTLICGKSRTGNFQILRKTRGDRMRATLKRVKDELRRRMHQPIPEQGQWLQQVVMGFFAYHAVPTNCRALLAFPPSRSVLWKRTLSRRSQKATLTWERMLRLVRRLASATRASFIPGPATLRRQPPKVGAECLNWARSDLCGGRAVMRVPTANRIGREPSLTTDRSRPGSRPLSAPLKCGRLASVVRIAPRAW